ASTDPTPNSRKTLRPILAPVEFQVTRGAQGLEILRGVVRRVPVPVVDMQLLRGATRRALRRPVLPGSPVQRALRHLALRVGARLRAGLPPQEHAPVLEPAAREPLPHEPSPTGSTELHGVLLRRDW